MANKKINELDVRASLSLSDLMLVGDPATGYAYKTTLTDIKTLIATEADTLQTVTDRGATTTNSITAAGFRIANLAVFSNDCVYTYISNHCGSSGHIGFGFTNTVTPSASDALFDIYQAPAISPGDLFTFRHTLANSTGNSTNYNIINIATAINQTGGSNGIVRGVYYNPTLTNVVGTHYAYESTSGKVKISDTFTYIPGTSVQTFTAETNVTYGSGASISSGAFTGSFFSLASSTFNGNITVPNSVIMSSQLQVNKLKLNSDSMTVTMTQAASLRALAGQIQQIQVDDTSTAGTVTHVAGIQILSPYKSTGSQVSFTNYYGLAINASDEYSSQIAVTNRWGIFQQGANDRNYFAGKILAGTSTDAGSYIFQATGQIRLNSYTSSTSYTGTAAGYLAFDSSGNVISTAAPTASNIYTADGTLTGNRTISTTSGYTLTINPSTSFISSTTINAGVSYSEKAYRYVSPLGNITAIGYVSTGLTSGSTTAHGIRLLDPGYGSFYTYGTLYPGIYAGLTGAEQTVINSYNSLGLYSYGSLRAIIKMHDGIDLIMSTVAGAGIQWGTNSGGNISAAGKIFQTGNITIGGTTDAGYKLDVQGTARVSGDVMIGSGSQSGYKVRVVGGIFADASCRFGSTQIDNGFTSTGGSTFVGSQQTIRDGSALLVGGVAGNSTIDASAIVEIRNTTKGFLPPRMTSSQKTSIASPVAGLIVYDTTLNKLCVYTTAWETITSA